jgi:hypothetical protein
MHGVEMALLMPNTDQLLNPNFIYLLLGFVFLCWAIVSTCTGKAYSGRGGWAYRSANPGDFWCSVAVLYLGSIVCIGRYVWSLWSMQKVHPG